MFEFFGIPASMRHSEEVVSWQRGRILLEIWWRPPLITWHQRDSVRSRVKNWENLKISPSPSGIKGLFHLKRCADVLPQLFTTPLEFQFFAGFPPTESQFSWNHPPAEFLSYFCRFYVTNGYRNTKKYHPPSESHSCPVYTIQNCKKFQTTHTWNFLRE